MTDEELAREEELAEAIKYHAARFVWRNRDGRTVRRIPWPDWFEKNLVSRSVSLLRESHGKRNSVNPNHLKRSFCSAAKRDDREIVHDGNIFL